MVLTSYMISAISIKLNWQLLLITAECEVWLQNLHWIPDGGNLQSDFDMEDDKFEGHEDVVEK